MVQFIYDFIEEKLFYVWPYVFISRGHIRDKKRLSFPEYASKERLQFFIKEQLL